MSTKARKPVAVWVTLNGNEWDRTMVVWRKRPTRNRNGEYSGVWIQALDFDFIHVTGFELKPGECKKVRFSVEVLDD